MKKLYSISFIIAMLLLLASCDGGGDEGVDSKALEPVLDNPETDPGTGAPPALSDPGENGDTNAFQELVLSLINQARAQGLNCGNEVFPPVADVLWDDRIASSALNHSQDMAQMEALTHNGSDGSDAGDRLFEEGYDAFSWGENLLVGLDDAQSTIEALFDSPVHCAIMMGASFQEVGMASAVGAFQGVVTTYWTLVFATEK